MDGGIDKYFEKHLHSLINGEIDDTIDGWIGECVNELTGN